MRHNATSLKSSQAEETIVAAVIFQCLVNPTLELVLCRFCVRLLGQRRIPSDPVWLSGLHS